MNVLVIEDDSRIAELVARALTEEGNTVTVATNGREGVDLLCKNTYSAALLDVYLPMLNGFEVLQQVRARHCKTPILMLTAVDDVPKIVQAFDLGADDYLVKPFILEILLARVSAVARRAASVVQAHPMSVAGIMLDRGRRIVVRQGKEIALTKKQFDLLDVLMRHNGRITTREQLVEAGWGPMGEVKENTLDVYIHGLRSKLSDSSDEGQALIRTVHGSGYMFTAN